MTHAFPGNAAHLATDATNRAWRTLAVNLAADLAVALALVLTTALNEANDWSDLEWNLLGFTLAKTVVTTIGSYVLRRFLDPSHFPTPLPPEFPGEPNEDTPDVA